MTGFGYQLYSSRNFPPLQETLTMLSGLGYETVEGYGALFGSGVGQLDLSEALNATDLRMPTAHFAFDAVRETPDEVIGAARMLGVETVVVPAIPPALRPEDAPGWVAFGSELAEAGKPFQDAGLEFAWHNHAFELVDLGGADKPLDLILQGSDVLKFEIDIAWIVVGGEDPLDWLRRYPDRIVAAHIKDLAREGENLNEDGWADVGQGVLDWAEIMPALAQTPVRHLIMEHDNPSDDRRFAERSLAAARQIAGA